MQVVVSLIFLALLITTLISVFKGAPLVVSDKKTINEIIRLSAVKKGDRIVDLGSGDGRVMVEFAKLGAIVDGFEINPLLVLWSKLKIQFLGLSKNTHVYLKNMWSVDLSNYDVIVVFGISYIMADLENKLAKEAKKGCLVITQSYPLPRKKEYKSAGNLHLYKF